MVVRDNPVKREFPPTIINRAANSENENISQQVRSEKPIRLTTGSAKISIIAVE
jgi:hypothetical protein